jgi:hypothetical protein
MSSFALAAASWTCITAAVMTGPNESVVPKCEAPAPIITVERAPVERRAMIPTPSRQVEKIDKPKAKARTKRKRGACGAKRQVWYVSASGRRKYKCR